MARNSKVELNGRKKVICAVLAKTQTFELLSE